MNVFARKVDVYVRELNMVGGDEIIVIWNCRETIFHYRAPKNFTGKARITVEIEHLEKGV